MADDETSNPSRDAAPDPRPRSAKKGLKRAAKIGTVLLENREILIQALELLRRTQTVTPHQEAQLVAAYEQGTTAVRDRLVELVNNLQVSQFGDLIVQLRSERDAVKGDLAGLRGDLRGLGKEFKGIKKGLKKEIRGDLVEIKADLKKEGRALVKEGQVLVDQYKGELQQFIDDNQPTIEAVQAVGHDLADAGRELAAAVKVAGKDAADELIRRGKKAMSGIDTDEMEQAALGWSIRTAPKIEHAVSRVLVGLGFFFIALGLLVGGLWYPPIRTAAIIATGLAAFGLGVYFLLWSRRLHRAMRARIGDLERLASMPPRERRAFYLEKWKTTPGYVPADERDALGEPAGTTSVARPPSS